VIAAPDGRWAALVATRANVESNVLDSNIWVVDLETGEASQLAFASKRDWHPRFSPDGRELAFLSDRDGTTTIWKMRVARGEAEELFDAAGDVEAFEWLPDGSGWIFTFYRALKLNGVNVEMVIYPREPHGFREPKHIRDAMERNLQWFEHWLSDGGPTSEP